ncbi:MAG: ATP-grasp domain-containing protein [Bacteroidales bacterium]|nr:ATP-grasp domain-containing protein [Bacteroidales bacterium]
MKKLAIIGASYLQQPLVEKAKEMGLYTLCFAWTEGAVCADIADKFYPISIVEKDEILAICENEQIDGICTIASDVAAPTVAYIAEKMGLVGNSYESACNANNKYEMRKIFSEAGVPCPKFKVLHILEDAAEINYGFPLIVKPVDRSGSLGVAKVNSKSELDDALANALEWSFCNQAIVEEYVEGREISVEFISYKGKHYPLQITDKVTTGAPHFVELEHHQPADLSLEMYDSIYALTDKALSALGITNGASHSEYRITDGGRIVVMEIGGRMGGDFIGSDLVKLSTGYDFLQGIIDVALGSFTEPKFTCRKHAGVYFLCKETERLLPIMQKKEREKEIVNFEITNPDLKSVTCSADRSGYIIYQGCKKILL